MNRITIDGTNVRFIVAACQDNQGKESFTVYYDNKVLRFRLLESVLDFINMNQGSFGYVEK